MNKSYNVDELILNIEYNEDQQSRIESLKTLRNLELLNVSHINFLEDLATGDTNLIIRQIALTILINEFYEKIDSLIEWIFQFEKNPRIAGAVARLLFEKKKDDLKQHIIRFLDNNVKGDGNLSLKKYNKELSKLFRNKSLNSFSSKELKNIYLNYIFIINLEKKFKFSENLNTNSLSYNLKEGLIIELRIWGLSLKKVSEIDGIELLNVLRVLDLSGNNLQEINGLESLKSLEILKFGDLSYDTGNQITQIKGLSSLKNLEILNLSNNHIKEIKGLEKLLNLKRLYLVNNSLEEIKGLNMLHNLAYLNLENNHIMQIQGIDKLISLEVLVLGKNSIVRLEIPKLPNLKEIRIYDNPLSEIEPTKLKNEIELKLYFSEIQQMMWLNSISGIKIKRVGTEKPTEYNSRYLQ
jgi:hypothetical protein